MPRPERAPKKPVPGEKKRPALSSRLESLGRRPLSFVLTSILLLVPCFWQSRIHAGDLSSHIYNAWLVQLVASGKTIGLTITSQLTNVLTDFMLSGLFRAFGADAAQRITVAVCVLVF